MNKLKDQLTKRTGKPIFFSSTSQSTGRKKGYTAKKTVRRKKDLKSSKRTSHSVKVKRKYSLRPSIGSKSRTNSIQLKKLNKRSDLFRYTDSYGGYFHLFEYIEDPGKEKEKVKKDELYHLRR